MKRWFRVLIVVQAFVAAVAVAEPIVQEYPLPKGDHPHDVAPAADGGVWYTAQHSGALGWLDPKTGDTRHIPLGEGSRPHGVIAGAYPLDANRPHDFLLPAAEDGQETVRLARRKLLGCGLGG